MNGFDSRVPGQLIPEAMSPYKRPRPQSPHPPPREVHGFIGYPPDHRFTMTSSSAGHFSALYPTQASRDHVRHHVQDLSHINYPDHHSQRDVAAFTLQAQIKRRPSLLSEFHGHHSAAERDGRREYYARSFEPVRLASGNHHPDNDIIAAKRRRVETENEVKFRPVPDAVRSPVTSSHQEVKKEPFIPKVENVSPTPCDEESPSKVSKEGLLQSMEKVDREIATVESQMANLKKKKQELELRAAQPMRDRQDSSDPAESRQQQNSVQIIYAENRKKAEAAHNILGELGDKNELPLYNQPSDNPKYQEVLKRNYELSRKFIQLLRNQQQARRLREQQQCQLYNQRMEIWEKNVDQLDASGKNRSRDVKVREFFEKQFPEIRKQREQQERFSRAGTRSWGNIARSDAELAEIVDGLNEQEASERHMRSLTVIPPLLFDAEQRRSKFINNNGIVEDAMQEYKDRQRMNVWTEEEKEIFREKYFQHPKNFGVIATFLDRKSVADTVLYYYTSKKNENYKQRKSQIKRRRNFTTKSNTSMSRNQEDDDKDDKEDSNQQESKNKEGGSLKEGVIEGISQKEDTSNGPPMSAPTNCALCRHSLDAYTLSRPLSRANCELLGFSENEITSNMRVCSKCRFKSLRKSRCPVTSCKTAKRKARRLKPLPTKWTEISQELRNTISEELGLTPEVTRCCPACFNRIVRRLGSEGPEDSTSTSPAASSRLEENYDQALLETTRWTEEETRQIKEAMRQHGKQWDVIAKMIGTKTGQQCKTFYINYPDKIQLEQILHEHTKKMFQREHRISATESCASTMTAASEDDSVPFSDGEHDADESSDTASASENEEESLQKMFMNASLERNKIPTDSKTKDQEKEVENMEVDKVDTEEEMGQSKDEGLRTNGIAKEENATEKLCLVEESVPKATEINQRKFETAVDDGDSSATCSADEGHPHDPDLPFPENSKTVPSVLPAQISNRVSSSEDDTKLSELRVRLGGLDHRNKLGNNPVVTGNVSAASSSTNENVTNSEAKSSAVNNTSGTDADDPVWEKQGIRNMKDLIDSAIHKHLGQERGPSPKVPAKNDKENTMPTSISTENTASVLATSTKEPHSTPPLTTPLSEKRTDNHSDTLHQETVTNSDRNSTSPLQRTSHISHTSHISEKDLYEAGAVPLQSPKSRSPGNSQMSPAQVDSVSSRGSFSDIQQNIEREQNRLTSPSGANTSGRHSYSPRSSTGSPYVLVPATYDRHLVGPQAPRPLQRQTKPSSTVPPPPPLSKLSPKAIKTEQHSPIGPGMHHPGGIIHGGSIMAGTPVNFSRSSGSPMRFDSPPHKQPYGGLLTTGRPSSPPTTRHEYGSGSITQGTPLVRRDQPQGVAHNRGPPGVISTEALHRMQLNAELAGAHGPSGAMIYEGLRGLRPPFGALDGGLPVELAQARAGLLDKGAMEQAAMYYIYTQRHPMGYGEYNPGLVRGQYESGAYSSSKETLAGDFQTAKQMRMPYPPTTQSISHKDPRHSPRHEAPPSKRSSPAHHPSQAEAISTHAQLLRYGAPLHHQGGIMLLPHYLIPGPVATSPHLIHPYPTGAPSLPSPRSPHSSTPHPSNAHNTLPTESRPQKTHSPSVHHRGQIPAELAGWARAQGQGLFKPPSRVMSPGAAAGMIPGSVHFGIRASNAAGGSIMHGTPIWQTPSIVSGTPNPELRDRKNERGPSPSRTKSPITSRVAEAYRSTEITSRLDHGPRSDHVPRSEHGPRPEHGSRLEHGSRPEHASRLEHGSRPDHGIRSDHGSSPQEKESRRTPNNPHGMTPEIPNQRRPASSPGVNREHGPMSSSHGEKKHPASRPGPQSQDSYSMQPKRESGERHRQDKNDSKDRGAADTSIIAAIFGPSKTESPGSSFTAASLIDHIISKSINQPVEEDSPPVPSQAPQSQTVSTPPVVSQPNLSRTANSLINQFIVHQIKQNSEEERNIPDSQNHPGKAVDHGGDNFGHDKGSWQVPSTYASRHEAELRGNSTPSHGGGKTVGNISGSPHLRSISIGDHIASIVSKECQAPGQPHPQGVAHADSTNSYNPERSQQGRGSEAALVEHRNSQMNDMNSLKMNRTGSPGDSARPDSSNMHVKRSSEAIPISYSEQKDLILQDCQSSRADSTASISGHDSHGNIRPNSTSRISPVTQNHQSPERNSEAVSRPPSSHDGYNPNSLSPAFHQGSGREQNRVMPAWAESSVIRTSPHNSNNSPFTHANTVSSSRQLSTVDTAQQILNNSINSACVSSRSKNHTYTFNFQESINRMIENQVRMTDNSAGSQSALHRLLPQEMRNSNISSSYHNERIHGEIPDSRVERTKASSMPVRNHMGMSNRHINNEEFHLSNESSVHSSNIVSSSPPLRDYGPHGVLPPSSQPGFQPGNPYAYSALSFPHMNQPQPSAQHGQMMRTPSPHVVPGQRTSPVPGPGMIPREQSHAPILSSQFEDLSDSDD